MMPRRSQTERREEARKNLLAAARTLISERGIGGFSLADVGTAAGVSRGLPGYHFSSRQRLVEAVCAELLEDMPAGAELGLSPLLHWVREQTDLAGVGAAEVKIALILAFDPTADLERLGLRERYWSVRSAFIGLHLARASVLRQIRTTIDPKSAGQVILGLLHGELHRRLTFKSTNSEAFLDLLETSLAAEQAAARSKSRAKAPAPRTKPDLFN